jgi:hypothetical protein
MSSAQVDETIVHDLTARGWFIFRCIVITFLDAFAYMFIFRCIAKSINLES